VTETALAVIVAHGAPSDPDPLDREVKELAQRVEALAGGLRVLGATLSKSGSLETALKDTGPAPATLIYPFFMSNGWFVSKELRRRVAATADAQVHYLEPFGLDDSVPALCVMRARQTIEEMGQHARSAVLVLAAHGSQKGPAAADAARAIQERIVAAAAFKEVRLGFVEEAPTIAEAAAGLGGLPAVCLPLFATTAGHVLGDIPEQLAEAGFQGKLMAAIGEDEEVARVIAAALLETHQTIVTAEQ
jgi:sirohydrochlorin ferrochelatase